MAFWKKKPGEIEDQGEDRTVVALQEQPVGNKDHHSEKVTIPACDPEPKASGKATVKTNHKSGVDLEALIAKRYGKLRTALSSGTVIQGKLSFDTPVRIDGKLEGEVFSSAALIVGPQGQVDAKINVQSLIVLGQVRGKVKASERVEVFPGGEIDADVATNLLSVSEGSRLNGRCAASHSNVCSLVERDSNAAEG